jgi:DNA-binding NarL/FixJ family response regulator
LTRLRDNPHERHAPGANGRDAPEREAHPLRVLIVDDDPVVRRVLREVLHDAGVVVVADASDGRDAARLARFYRPDVVLLDVVMPGVDGITALEEIVATAGDVTKVMILSVRSDDAIAFLALRKGAMGVLNKDVDLAILPRVLFDLQRGHAVLTRSFTTKLVERLRRAPEGGIGMRPVNSVLTSREWQVLDRLCAGRSAEQIADEFVLSLETVRTHIKNIMRKLQVHSRAEAVAAAERLRVDAEAPIRDARSPLRWSQSIEAAEGTAFR